MRRLIVTASAALLVLGNLGVGITTAGAEGKATGGQQQRVEAPFGGEIAQPTALLSRLHQAAQREIQLGDLAKTGGAHRDTRAYGAELAADFRAFDQKVIAFANASAIDETQLDRAFPGQNVVAMRRQVENLGRLANERGQRFDRDFWVAIAEEQSATSDMLPGVVVHEPVLSALVSDLSGLLERSSARALEVANADEGAAGFDVSPVKVRAFMLGLAAVGPVTAALNDRGRTAFRRGPRPGRRPALRGSAIGRWPRSEGRRRGRRWPSSAR